MSDPHQDLLITQSPSIEEWNSFLEASPHSTIFHTPEMRDVFEKTHNYNPLVYAVKNNNRILAMLNPVLIALKPGFMRILTTRAIHYGGPVYMEDEESKQALSILIRYYLKDIRHRALFSDFRNLTDTSSVMQNLEKTGFKKEPHVNYWIDIEQPTENIWNHFHPSVRKAIKKSINCNISYVEIKDHELLPVFYDNLKKTFSMKQVPLTDISLFKYIFDILVPKNMARFYLAYAEGQYFASFLVLLYKGVVYFWYSADNLSMRQYYPTHGFIWHILQWGHEKGYRLFDFGWAGRIDQPYGVRQFKEKFGGKLITFGRHVIVHKPALLKLSKIGYSILRNRIAP